MKVFLRHLGTAAFMRALGQWTNDPDVALDFGSTIHALACCRHLSLRDMEIVVWSHGQIEVCLDVDILLGAVNARPFVPSGSANGTRKELVPLGC